MALAALVPQGGSSPERPSKRLTVLAAASLTEVLPRIDAEPAYSFGGSNQLAFQIRQGAPADVFASASREFTQGLFRGRLVERPRTFARNSLVLAVPTSNPARLKTVFDLRRRAKVRLVIGTPQVPAGAYARQVLRRLGLTAVLTKVVSEEPDVKSIVGKLALGEADAGFVYRTDVRPVATRVRALALPDRAQPDIRYEVAVVKRSLERTAARRYADNLGRSKSARALLKQAGFKAP